MLAMVNPSKELELKVGDGSGYELRLLRAQKLDKLS
jgi:hypothetical protein